MGSPDFNPFATRACQAFVRHQKKNKVPMNGTDGPPQHPRELPDIRITAPDLLPIREPALIIGGGMAGLYIAMMLDSFDKKIPYTIVEAKDHVGGRVHTYSFNKGAKNYEYFDLGAMRFPHTPFMKRTFTLVDKLNEHRDIKDQIKLIPYKWEASNTFQYFNGLHVPRIPGELPLNPADPFNINATTTYNPNSYVPPSFDRLLDPSNIKKYLEDVSKELKRFFIEDQSHPNFDRAMELTVQMYDKYTMRSYLSEVKKLPPSVINLLETFDKGTGWYDRSLVDMICEDLAFNWLSSARELDWKCFDGGSSTLPNAMEQYLKERGSTVTKNTSVVSIVDPNLNTPGQPRGGLKAQTALTSSGEAQASKTYPAVFCTAPLSTLGMMELSKSGIHSNYAQWSGIRELLYGPAMKIGIRFKTNWWAEKFDIVGGQSFTDLPLRTIVYPSYPEHGIKSNVLIVSYCWTQDAERLGAYVNNDTGALRGRGLEMVLNMVKAVHGIDESEDLGVLDAFAYDWLRDPLAMGGFAFFGPQQFEDPIWVQMSQPACNGQLFFAGEASSSSHFWVAGALESAWTAVLSFLKTYGYPENVKQEFLMKWGDSQYWEKKNDYEQLDTHIKLGLFKSGVNPIYQA